MKKKEGMFNRPVTVMATVIVIVANIFIISPKSVYAEETGKFRMYELETKSAGFNLPNDLKKIVFSNKGNAIEGWLRQNGDWYIEATIQHQSFLCADYRVGVRFGQGEPACVNVNWFTEVQYATQKKQCNNAIMNHSGYQTNSDIVKHFDSVTCAKVIIKCEGSC